MSTDNASLTYELEAQIGKFSSAFDAATKTASASFDQITSAGRDAATKMEASIGSAVQSVASGFESLLNPAKSTGDAIKALVGGGLVAAAAGFAATMTEMINALSSAGDRADDLRLPINILQALSVAADEARVPTDKLNDALNTFTSVSKKAADDAKDFYKALGNIGSGFVKAFQAAPSQAERLRILMDAFKATTDEVKRAQLAQEAFGSDNQRIISMFSGGRDAMNGYIQQMRTLGLEIDESAVRKAQEAKSALSALSRVMTDQLSSALAELIPSFKEFLPYLDKMAGMVRDTVAGFASPENRPLTTLKNDAAAAQEQLVQLQADLKALDDYKPVGGVVGGLAKRLGLNDVETATDKSGALAGVAVNIEDARQRIQAEIGDTQQSLAKFKQLIAQKEALEKANKGHDGAEAPAFKPRPKLNKDDDDDSKAFDKAVSGLNKHAAGMEADAAAVGMTTDRHQQLRAEVELLNAAQKSGTKITNDQIDAYAKLRATMSETQALAAAGITLTSKEATALDQVSSRTEAAAKTLESAKRQFAGLNDALKFAGDDMVDTFDNMLNHATTWQASLQSILKQVQKSMLQAVITGGGPFGQLFGFAGQNGGVGGLMGGLLKLFGGARAGGGDVDPGKAFLVGEKGPEIFSPKSAGTIIPNHQLALGGGGARVNNTQQTVNHITVQGGAGNAHQNQDLAEKIAGALNDQAQRAVMDAIRQQTKPGGVLYG